MRLGLLVLVLLLPVAGAETVLKLQDHAPPGFTVTPTVSVWQEGALATHQNMGIEFLHGNEIVWRTSSMHEHDGLNPMLYTLRDTTTVVAYGDQTVTRTVTTGSETPPGDASRATMINTELQFEDGELRLVKQDDRGTRGIWVVRDAQGPVLSGWVAGHSQREWHVATLHGDSQLHASHLLIGRIGSREIIGESMPAASMSNLPSLADLSLGACTDVHLDPEQFFAGNSMRVVAGNRAQLEGVPREQDYRYELRHVVSPGVEHELVYSWLSGGPLGQTSFRPPFAGAFELYVMRPQLDCKVAFTVQEGSTQTAVPVWNFTQENNTIRFEASVPGDGHYEFPLQHRFRDGTLESGKLLWAGKLHSHGGAVSFTAEAVPGNHTVVFDVGAQGPDPLVASPDYGFVAHLYVPHPEPPVVPSNDTPVPMGLAILALAGAMFLRR